MQWLRLLQWTVKVCMRRLSTQTNNHKPVWKLCVKRSKMICTMRSSLCMMSRFPHPVFLTAYSSRNKMASLSSSTQTPPTLQASSRSNTYLRDMTAQKIITASSGRVTSITSRSWTRSKSLAQRISRISMPSTTWRTTMKTTSYPRCSLSLTSTWTGLPGPNRGETKKMKGLMEGRVLLQRCLFPNHGVAPNHLRSSNPKGVLTANLSLILNSTILITEFCKTQRTTLGTRKAVKCLKTLISFSWVNSTLTKRKTSKSVTSVTLSLGSSFSSPCNPRWRNLIGRSTIEERRKKLNGLSYAHIRAARKSTAARVHWTCT